MLQIGLTQTAVALLVQLAAANAVPANASIPAAVVTAATAARREVSMTLYPSLS